MGNERSRANYLKKKRDREGQARMAADSTNRQMIFSVPEGGEVVITYPEPMTAESILMVEELCAIWFRGLHRRAIKRQQVVDADVEYASWFPGDGLDRQTFLANMERNVEQRNAGASEGAKHTFAPSVHSVLPPMSGLSGEGEEP